MQTGCTGLSTWTCLATCTGEVAGRLEALGAGQNLIDCCRNDSPTKFSVDDQGCDPPLPMAHSPYWPPCISASTRGPIPTPIATYLRLILHQLGSGSRWQRKSSFIVAASMKDCYIFHAERQLFRAPR